MTTPHPAHDGMEATPCFALFPQEATPCFALLPQVGVQTAGAPATAVPPVPEFGPGALFLLFPFPPVTLVTLCPFMSYAAQPQDNATGLGMQRAPG